MVGRPFPVVAAYCDERAGIDIAGGRKAFCKEASGIYMDGTEHMI